MFSPSCLIDNQSDSRKLDINHESIAFSVGLLFLLFTSATFAETETQFGEELSDILIVDLVEIMTNPVEYVDKNIKIAGNIKNVCPRKGCWIEIENAEADISLRVKVEDDVIVFPTEAKGKSVVAEGTFRAIKLDEKRTKAWLRHRAQEVGGNFDESEPVEPMTLYQIDGTGAEIADLSD